MVVPKETLSWFFKLFTQDEMRISLVAFVHQYVVKSMCFPKTHDMLTMHGAKVRIPIRQYSSLSQNFKRKGHRSVDLYFDANMQCTRIKWMIFCYDGYTLRLYCHVCTCRRKDTSLVRSRFRYIYCCLDISWQSIEEV
jgi:hypothetical protein